MESWKVQKKMLVELVLRGPDNDGDFEVEVLKRLAKLETYLCFHTGKVFPFPKFKELFVGVLVSVYQSHHLWQPTKNAFLMFSDLMPMYLNIELEGA